LNKNDLKSLVKECLLEILVEGVGSPRNMTEGVPPRKAQQSLPRKAADLISYAPKKAQAHVTRPPVPPRAPNKEQFRSLANGNDVMASIFADTASSGLVESLGDPSNRQPGNPVVDTGVDPSVFDGAENWAHLAFTDGPNRQRA